VDEKEKAEAQRTAQKDAERVRAFQVMVAGDGWRFFIELLNGKVEELAADMFERPKEGDERGEAHDKGTCYGLLWARDLPAVTIKAFNRQEDSDEDN